MEEPASFFSRENWEWSIVIGDLTTLGVIGLNYALGIPDNPDFLYGTIMSLVSSVAVGLLVGLVAFYAFFKH